MKEEEEKESLRKIRGRGKEEAKPTEDEGNGGKIGERWKKKKGMKENQ